MSFRNVAVAVLMLFVLALSAACVPSDEELAAMVAAEVERQVALIPPTVNGEQGEQGPQGPQASRGQGPKGDTGPQGPPGPAGATGPQESPGMLAEPNADGPTRVKSLEVGQLVIRREGSAQFLIMDAGTENRAASNTWVSSANNRGQGSIVAGTTDGMVLRSGARSSAWIQLEQRCARKDSALKRVIRRPWICYRRRGYPLSRRSHGFHMNP